MYLQKDIDCFLYAERRSARGKGKVRVHNVAPWLYRYFNNTPYTEQSTGITEGKDMLLPGIEIRFSKGGDVQ